MIIFKRRRTGSCARNTNSWMISQTVLVTFISLGILGGCGSILPKAPIQPTLYVLDALPFPPSLVPVAPLPPSLRPPTRPILLPQQSAGTSSASTASNPSEQSRLAAPTLTVSTPIASAGFGSTHIVYQRQAHELEHFALNQWVDTPVQMLMPLMVRTLESSGAFRAVVRGSTAAISELRLDTELIRLQQEFYTSPSHVRLTMRAVMVDAATRRVLASREFEASVASPSEDPAGGVVAANLAVQNVLAQISKFCVEFAAR